MSAVLAIIVGAIIIAVDQLTKYIVVSSMTLYETVPFLSGFLDFYFTYNKGAAFGTFSGDTWFLITITGIIMVICVCMLVKRTFNSNWMFWALCLVLAGGLGNMIDRVFRGGKVVDFLKLGFIDFPVFNIADCAVCIGAIMIVIYFFKDFINETRNKKRIAKITEDSEALAAEAGQLPMDTNENDQ